MSEDEKILKLENNLKDSGSIRQPKSKATVYCPSGKLFNKGLCNERKLPVVLRVNRDFHVMENTSYVPVSNTGKQFYDSLIGTENTNISCEACR